MKLIKLLFCLIIGAMTNPLSAQFFYNETCRNTTGVFQYYGDAIGYTAALSVNPDPIGDGWLRLVENKTNQNGYVLLDKTFPSTMGVSIEFDFKVWVPNGTIADGFSVFLFDGDSSKPFIIGDAGGSLGYRNLHPAYLGVGIDEWGNFSGFMSGGPGYRKSAIAVADANYIYKAGTAANLGDGTYLEYTLATPIRPHDTTYYRRVRIEIEPISGGMSVTTYIKTAIGGTFKQVLGPVNIIQTTPPLLRLGFNASTGAGYGYHEVRNVIVRTPGEMAVYKSIPEGCPSKDNVIINTIIVNGTDSVVQNIIVNDTFPIGYLIIGGTPVVSSSGTISGFTTTVLGDGRTVCNYTIDAAAESNTYIVYTGSFSTIPPEGHYVSSVEIIPPVSFNNHNLNDTSASVTGYFCSQLVNDTLFLINGNDIRFDVRTNDILDCAETSILDTVSGSGLHHGSLVINTDTTFTYTSLTGFFGIDSVDYYIKCAADSNSARVYILKSKSLSQQYVACIGASVTMGFTAIPDVTYRWYNADGTILVNPSANTITVIKGSASDIGTWWVEPRYKGIAFPRYRVELEASVNCGNTSPIGCAATGIIIYKEDFGGNSPADLRTSVTPLPPGYIDLFFCPNGLCVAPTYGYSFLKYIVSSHATIIRIKGGDDHTYWGDTTRGYFMSIDPAVNNYDYKLYSSKIKDLCVNTNLSFTIWAADWHSGPVSEARPKIEMLIKDARTGETIVTSGIFTLYREPTTQYAVVWRQYGFDFAIPSGVDSILFTVINKEINNIGNDWFMDDIEIRLCVPPVNLNITNSIICSYTEIEVKGDYTDNGTFGENLTYRWEFKHADSINWETLLQKDTTIILGNTLETVWKIDSATKDTEGYYRLIVTSQGNINSINCRAMKMGHISVSTSPELTVGNDRAVCYDSTAVLTISSKDAVSYRWCSDANYKNTIINAALFETPKLKADTVFYAETISPDGCISRDTVHVTVYSLPELIVNDIAVCYDSTAVLTVSSKDAVSYRWCSDANYKNTIINAASFETPALESDTVFYIEVVSPHGCISRDTVRVTVYPLTDLSVQDTIVCYGSTITLTASSTNAVSFGWYSDAAHTNLVGQGATFQTNVLTADIKLYVKATSVNGCSSYSAIVVFVSSHLTSVITPDTCNKSIGQIALTITSDHPTTIVCTWEGLSDTSRVLVGLEGNKTYSVVVTDSLCLERGVFLVPMISGPIADFLSNNDIPVGTQLILTDISQGSIVRRDWDFGDDTKDTFTNKVVFHTYAAMGYYPVTLIVTDTNNCMDSVSKTIRVSEDIRVYIPNIFTPNGDGINDTWGPVMSGFRSEGYLLSVFDRWGSTVYKSTNPLEKWDGSIRGSHIQGNIVYTYRLIVRDMLNVEHEYIGSVTVVR